MHGALIKFCLTDIVSIDIGIHIDLNSVFKHKIWGSVQIRTNTKNWWSNTVFELVIGQRPWWCDFVSISVPNHYIGYKTYDPCLNICCDKIMNTCLYKCSYTIHRSKLNMFIKIFAFQSKKVFLRKNCNCGSVYDILVWEVELNRIYTWIFPNITLKFPENWKSLTSSGCGKCGKVLFFIKINPNGCNIIR